MVRTRVVWKGLVTVACLLLSQPAAWAQQSPSGIAGAVRDESGAVLPGVTVEAASPALIEQLRVVYTDGRGRFNIVDLRPGTYTVTFTLPGFNTVRREGIVLTAGFTATVNADLVVGAIEETITVTGAAPLVDTQNVRSQNLLSQAELEALPTGQMNWTTATTTTPGLTNVADVGSARGVWSGHGVAPVTYHGKQGAKTMYDGMRTQNVGTNNPGYFFNHQTVEQMTVETGGLSAEASDAVVVMNLIPKEGGNNYAFTATGLFTNDSLQSNNVTDELRAQGFRTADQILNMYDGGLTMGGPIKRDRLWIFTGVRHWGSTAQIADTFWNATQNTPVYTPDFNRPAERFEKFRSYHARLTWQASQRNKFSYFIDYQNNRLTYQFNARAIESSNILKLSPAGFTQGGWNSPLTNRFLLEANAAWSPFYFPQEQQPGVTRDSIATLERSTNRWYNAPPHSSSGSGYRDPNRLHRWGQRFAASYVTGSHAFKMGVQMEQGVVDYTMTEKLLTNDGISHIYNRGVPEALRLRAFPWREYEIMKADMGIFAQDQWSFDRWTLNYGVRYAYVNWYVPALSLAAGPLLPAREFPAVHKVPEWHDVVPRVGIAYDLFGTGRTALRLSVGKYLEPITKDIVAGNNPVNAAVSLVDRPWNDSDRDFVPDCDMRNFGANGECGPVEDENFGKSNPDANRYADDVNRGSGVRMATWDIVAELQHELRPGISITGGYSRNWDRNFLVTDNLALTSDDYDPFCITAPSDPRLPGGGGYQVCGLYDITPAKFGRVSNLVSRASNFGEQTRVADFFYAHLSTQFGGDLRLRGGIDFGRNVTDRCFVVDSPQELLHCRVEVPWKQNLQIKLNGSYPLPGDFRLSATYQNVPGVEVLANYAVPVAQVTPSLGRPLAGGRRSVTVPLVAPQTVFEDRLTQVDVRITKLFNLTARYRLQANVDLYNAFNASTVLTVNNAFGAEWRRAQSILDGRMVQISATLNF